MKHNLNKEGITNEAICWGIGIGADAAISWGLAAFGGAVLGAGGFAAIAVAAVGSYLVVKTLDALGVTDKLTNFALECWSGLKSFCGGGEDGGNGGNNSGGPGGVEIKITRIDKYANDF